MQSVNNGDLGLHPVTCQQSARSRFKQDHQLLLEHAVLAATLSNCIHNSDILSIAAVANVFANN